MYKSRIVVSSLCLIAASTASANAADVPWRTGATALSATTADDARQILNNAADSQNRHVIVGFSDVVEADRHLALQTSGLTLLSYLGNGAYFAAVLPDRIDADAIIDAPTFETVATIERDWKMHPIYARGETPPYTIRPNTNPDDPQVAAYIILHRDVDLTQTAQPLAARHGATIVSPINSVNGLVIELPRSEINAMADEDVVQWIEPALPQLVGVNAENRELTQANTVQQAPYNLDGSGVRVLVFDSGNALESHNDFGGRLTVRDSDSLSNHSTHVAGTIGGNGGGIGVNQRGMAPNVIMESYGFSWDSGDPYFLYTNPGDIEVNYSEAINVYDVDIANNSIGSNTATNGFPCEHTGDYGVTDTLIDAIVTGSLGRPFDIVWANGNERQTSNCGNQYYTTAPPACAKNQIAVGAVNANDDSITWFTSWGPCDDGRMRPDISAPGCQEGGDGGVTSSGSSNDNDDATLCGTSMAAPTVTGLSALLLQDIRAQFPSLFDIRNATLKAILAHTAVDRGNTGPDYQFGFGSVRVQDAIDHTRTGQFNEDLIFNGQTHTFTVDIDPGDDELKVTLAWDDAPGTPNVIPSLVNDLDIVAISPSEVNHFPWTLNPDNPGSPAVRTQADHLNNLEQVLVDNPESGQWTIEVRATSVPEGPQTYSIVGDGAQLLGTFVTVLDELPTLVPPNEPVIFDVRIAALGEDILEGSQRLLYRFDDGFYQETPLTHTGGDIYQAILPGAGCGDQPQFYVIAEGELSGITTDPINAPADVFSHDVGELQIFVQEDFENDPGWTVSGDAGDGQWDRGVPVDCDRGDPSADYDGSGQCWLTDNSNNGGDCNSDVDDGTTTVTSGAYDVSQGGDLSYAYWFNDISTGQLNGDAFTVEAATNEAGTNWQEVREYTTASGSWRTDTILIGDEIEATSTLRVRFSANDVGTQNVVEAGLDALVVSRIVCDDDDADPPVIVHDDGALTRPFSGYVDPRAESDNGLDVNLGIDSLNILFSETVQAVGGGALAPGDFTVTGTGSGHPSVASVDDTQNPLIGLTLTGLIPLQEWTTVIANVQDEAGNVIINAGDQGPGVDETDRVDIGYLPADVDQNGSVTPNDLLLYRQYVNDLVDPTQGVEEDYVDTDRSGEVSPFDLLAFRQLINGNGNATQSWNGATLPTRP